MMDDILLQFGVAGVFGIFAVQVLRVALEHLEKRNKHINGFDAEGDFTGDKLRQLLLLVTKMADETHDLHVWHAPNSDGQQNWKDTRSIEVLERFDQTIKQNTLAIKALLDHLKGGKK